MKDSNILKDSERVRDLAIKTLFESFTSLCRGFVIVDKNSRVVWMNTHYPKLLGIADVDSLIGRPVGEVIPNTMMHQVVKTGVPIMLDIMDYTSESQVVTRVPLKDDEGNVIGAVGMTLENASHLIPLLSRYQQIRADLAKTRQRLADARRTRYTLSSFVGDTPACMELKRLARRAARTSSSVLLQGETGTGKELLAQAIHAMSPRADKSFIGVNLAAVPENLLEAEFFGVAPGAYTGAERRERDGKFKLADGGTLFLDEVADMPLSLQGKLLRVLEEREVEPIGSNHLIPVDVRVIAASSRNLSQMVANGSFRADLFYRLNVLSLDIPPLRDRLDDLPAICELLLEQHCRKLNLSPVEITRGAIALMRQYHWPGNVRELSNVLERVLLHGDSEILEVSVLERIMPLLNRQPMMAGNMAEMESMTDKPLDLLSNTLAKAEREAICAALSACKGNKKLAAEKLGISRASLYAKLASLGEPAGEAFD